MVLNVIIGVSITWLVLFGMAYANEISHNPQIVGVWELVLADGVPPGEHEDEAYNIFQGTIDTFFADGTGTSFTPGFEFELAAFNWWTRGDNLTISFIDFNQRWTVLFQVDEERLITTGMGEYSTDWVWIRID